MPVTSRITHIEAYGACQRSDALLGVATDAMTKATREQLYECISILAMNRASYWTWYGDLPEDELRHPSLRAMNEQQVRLALLIVRFL
jgi:hypothetical protein